MAKLQFLAKVGGTSNDPTAQPHSGSNPTVGYLIAFVLFEYAVLILLRYSLRKAHGG